MQKAILGLLLLVSAFSSAFASLSDPLQFRGRALLPFETGLEVGCSQLLKNSDNPISRNRILDRYMLLGFGFDTEQLMDVLMNARPKGEIFSLPIKDQSRLRRTLLIPDAPDLEKSEARIVFISNGEVNRWLRLEVKQTPTHSGWMWMNPFIPAGLLEKGMTPKQIELSHDVRVDPSRSYPGFRAESMHHHWSPMVDAPKGHKDIEKLSFLDLPTVFSGNNIYLRNLLIHTFRTLNPREKKVLVMGAGGGVETIAMAKIKNSVVHAVDINPMAVASVRLNSVASGVSKLVETWESNLFESVPTTEDGKYDLILFNMPYAKEMALKVHVDDSPGGNQSSRNLHDFGAQILSGFLSGLESHLAPGGRAIIMTLPNIDRYLPAGLEATQLGRFGQSSHIVGVNDDDGKPFAIQEIRRRSEM